MLHHQLTPTRISGAITEEQHQEFLAPLPGRKITSARGVSHSQSFYFVIVFVFLFYFILFASFIKNPKKIVSIIAFCFACYLLYHACYEWLIYLKLDLMGNMGSRKNNENIMRNTAYHKKGNRSEERRVGKECRL